MIRSMAGSPCLKTGAPLPDVHAGCMDYLHQALPGVVEKKGPSVPGTGGPFFAQNMILGTTVPTWGVERCQFPTTNVTSTTVAHAAVDPSCDSRRRSRPKARTCAGSAECRSTWRCTGATRNPGHSTTHSPSATVATHSTKRTHAKRTESAT